MQFFNRIIVVFCIASGYTFAAQQGPAQNQLPISVNDLIQRALERKDQNLALTDDAHLKFFYEDVLKELAGKGSSYKFKPEYSRLLPIFGSMGQDEKVDQSKWLNNMRLNSYGEMIVMPGEDIILADTLFPFIMPDNDILSMYYLLYGYVMNNNTIHALLKILNNVILLKNGENQPKRLKSTETGDGRTIMKLLVADKAKEALETKSLSAMNRKRLELLYKTFLYEPVVGLDGQVDTKTISSFTLEELQKFRDAAYQLEYSPLTYATMLKNTMKVNTALVGTGLGALALYNYVDPIKQFVDQTMPVAGRLAAAASNKLGSLFSWDTVSSLQNIMSGSVPTPATPPMAAVSMAAVSNAISPSTVVNFGGDRMTDIMKVANTLYNESVKIVNDKLGQADMSNAAARHFVNQSNTALSLAATAFKKLEEAQAKLISAQATGAAQITIDALMKAVREAGAKVANSSHAAINFAQKALTAKMPQVVTAIPKELLQGWNFVGR